MQIKVFITDNLTVSVLISGKVDGCVCVCESDGRFLCVCCRYGDHYQWNKVVTCIHNVFSQQRWLEHYGDVMIQNLKSDVCSCKITFKKVCVL